MGFGNLQRSSILAATFEQFGHRVRIDPVSVEARRLLPASLSNDDDRPDLWILDLPYQADRWVFEARQQKQTIVALDYEGRLSPDLVISIFDHGSAPSCSCHLVGFEYAIIRSDVSALAPSKSGNGVCVIIGGGDSDGLGEQAAIWLHSEGATVTLIEGPLAIQQQNMPPGVVRLRCPGDLAQRMASSQWAVTGGGTTMLEMLCLGKAVHALPRTPREQALTRLIYKQGALLGIGLGSLSIPSDQTRTEVGVKGGALVDGKGAARIVRAAEVLL